MERSEYSLFRLLKTAENAFPMEHIFRGLVTTFQTDEVERNGPAL